MGKEPLTLHASMAYQLSVNMIISLRIDLDPQIVFRTVTSVFHETNPLSYKLVFVTQAHVLDFLLLQGLVYTSKTVLFVFDCKEDG